MTEQPRKTPSESETEIWNAIAAFEKILEALPSDRVSLETLADAYEKVGDHTRAKDYLLRLANALIDEGDEDAVYELREKIQTFDGNDPQVKATLARIARLKPEKVMAMVLDDEQSASQRPVTIAGEIAFAWNLLQAKKLTQEDYTNIVHDLSENSSKKSQVPVSTLHVLHDRHFPALNDVLTFVAATCNTPLIALSNYDLQANVTALLPLNVMIKRGAIIFELMGEDALAAILNPYDTQLPADLEDLTGKTCHCFLVAPEDFDAALAKISKTLAAQDQ
jgi:tetratricopeptide (TPR) repeat protein